MSMTRFSIACLIPLAACAGTDTGNPFPQPLSLDAHSSEPDAYEVGAPRTGGVVAQVWLVTGGLTFTYEGDSEYGPEDAPGLGLVDHGADGATHQTVSLPPGPYSEVSFRFVIVSGTLPEGVPPGLRGGSIALVGTTAAGTGFTLISATIYRVTLADPDGATFEFGEDLGPLFVGFDVATWLAGIDIDGASVGGADVVIDAATNADLLATFESNLARGVELYRDADGDGSVEPPDDVRIAVGQ